MSAMLRCLRFNRNEPPARPTRRGSPWSTAILRSSSSCLFLRVGDVLGGAIREVDHHPRSIDSKLEVFHVGWRHDLRGTENNFCLRSNLVVAEAAGLEGFAFLSGDLALSEQLRAVISQIAEVFDIPPNILHRSDLYVFFDQGRRRQTRQFDLPAAPRLFHRASGGGEADAGGNDDALESRES